MTKFKPGDRVRNLWDNHGSNPKLLRMGTVLPNPDDCRLFEDEIYVQLDNPETLGNLSLDDDEIEMDDGKYILHSSEVEKVR
jgi:hypothetical protein